MRGVQKVEEPMKRMPYKTAEAQRRINKMFPKKPKTLTSACIFFNLLHDVSILVLFFIKPFI